MFLMESESTTFLPWCGKSTSNPHLCHALQAIVTQSAHKRRQLLADLAPTLKTIGKDISIHCFRFLRFVSVR